MKIIDVGICIDNIDPKGIGRIRCIRYNDYVGEKEKSLNYTKWEDTDPFIASPFLPTNINLIPEIGQSVKILNYNTEKETINQEYIPGPFTTLYDFNSQTFTQQVENTTYGVAVKHKPDIVNKKGELKNDKAQAAFAKFNDYGIYGKFGSDILFTENGLQLRGGKLVSKESANVGLKKLMIDVPIMAEKSARLYLKKFPKKIEKTQQIKNKQIIENKNLSSIIEYEVDSLSNPTLIKFFVYKVVNPYGQTFKTNFFNDTSTLTYSHNPENPIKLINLDKDNSFSVPTFTVNVTSIEETYKQIRIHLYKLHETGLSIFKEYSDVIFDLHPFYFRPSPYFNSLGSNNTELENKKIISNNVKLSSIIRNGLVWSKERINNKPKVIQVVEEIFVSPDSNPEQTFASLISDKIYLLSTDPTESNRKVDFKSLDKYEITQEDYLEKIDGDKNTFSMVRGENLIAVLRAIYSVLIGHQHNVMGPYVQPGFPQHINLETLINNLENDILNRSIKIN